MSTDSNKFTVTRSMALNKEQQGAIVGLKGFMEGKIKHLESDTTYVLGRDSSQCDILVKGAAVSRVHCRVTYDSEEKDYIVYDESKNGTIVDGASKLPKYKEVRMKGGRRLWIGDDENEIILG